MRFTHAKRWIFVLLVGASLVHPALPGAPGTVDGLEAQRTPGQPLHWVWAATPGADGYDVIGGVLPAASVANASCRTGEDSDPTDTSFDDALAPLPGVGLYVLVRANDSSGGGAGSFDSAAGNESRFNSACDPLAYFCVGDASGDSFVLKLTDPAKIDHARNVLSGIEQERVRVGALSTGGPVSWNPGWQFHIPPDAVYFFDQALEICDASIAAVDLGGPPRGSWCPWTSHIDGELLPPEQWQDSIPAPFYCGPGN